MQHFMHTSANATWQTRIRRLIDEHRCHSVYLDVGSNIGVQIRKLYEPSLYVGRDPKPFSAGAPLQTLRRADSRGGRLRA